MTHAKAGAVLPEFRIFETEEFRCALDRLPSDAQRRIRAKIEAHVYPGLRINPFSGRNIRKLRGYDPETWRYRIGAYRLFYCIDQPERIVFMLTVDHRKDAYR